MNRHPSPRDVGILRQVVSYGAVQPELAFLCQLQDQHRGELLGDRTDAELGVGGVGDAPLGVGQAVGLAVDHPAVIGDEDRALKAALLVIAPHNRIDLFGFFLSVRSCAEREEGEKQRESGRPETI